MLITRDSKFSLNKELTKKFEIKSIRANPFSNEEAKFYLINSLHILISQENTETIVNSLVSKLSCLPSALKIAVNHIKQGSLSIAEYIKTLDIDGEKRKSTSYLPFLNAQIGSLSQVVEQAKKDNKTQWFYPFIASAYLDNKEIPRYLLERVSNKKSVDIMEYKLSELSLITVVDSTKYSMHNLVQPAIRQIMEEQYDESCDYILKKLLSKLYSIHIENKCAKGRYLLPPDLVRQGKRLIYHAKRRNGLISSEMIGLFKAICHQEWLDQRDFEGTAKSISELIDEIKQIEKVKLQQHLSPLLDYLAFSYMSSGQNDKAAPLMKFISNAQGKSKKSQRPFWECLRGYWESYQGRYQEAEGIINELHEDIQLLEELDKGYAYHLLGNIYYYQNRLEESVRAYDKALEIKTKYFAGEQHFEVAITYHAKGKVKCVARRL